MVKAIVIGLLLSAQVCMAADLSPVPIGGILVLTGQYAMQGSAFKEGAELAVDEINASGGIEGRHLELRIEDSANLSKQALTAARKLIEVDKVSAVLTTSYTELTTGAAELQRQGIPVIHLWDASPEIENMGDYIFGIGPWIASSGETSARFAYQKLGARTAVIVNIHDPWSELVSGYFREEFQRLGGQVREVFAFNPQDQDFRAAFAKIRTSGIDVIYAPITDNIVPFYTQLRQSAVVPEMGVMEPRAKRGARSGSQSQPQSPPPSWSGAPSLGFGQLRKQIVVRIEQISASRALGLSTCAGSRGPRQVTTSRMAAHSIAEPLAIE